MPKRTFVLTPGASPSDDVAAIIREYFGCEALSKALIIGGTLEIKFSNLVKGEKKKGKNFVVTEEYISGLKSCVDVEKLASELRTLSLVQLRELAAKINIKLPKSTKHREAVRFVVDALLATYRWSAIMSHRRTDRG